MNKLELIDYVSSETGATKADAGRIIDSVIDGISKELKKRSSCYINWIRNIYSCEKGRKSWQKSKNRRGCKYSIQKSSKV
jgi:nucleoid DNA-binding protein